MDSSNQAMLFLLPGSSVAELYTVVADAIRNKANDTKPAIDRLWRVVNDLLGQRYIDLELLNTAIMETANIAFPVLLTCEDGIRFVAMISELFDSIEIQASKIFNFESESIIPFYTEPSTSGLNQIQTGTGLAIISEDVPDINVVNRRLKTIKALKTHIIDYEIEFPAMTSHSINPIEFLHIYIQKLLDLLLNEFPGHFKALIMFSNSPEDDLPVFLSLRRIDQINVDAILTRFGSVIQSNQNYLLDRFLHVQLTVIETPMGAGGSSDHRMKYSNVDFNEYCKRKNCFVVINNREDDMCLARALIVGKAYADKIPINDRKYICRSDKPRQLELAKKLCIDAGVSATGIIHGGTMDHLSAFQKYLSDYVLTVFYRNGTIMYKDVNNTICSCKYIDLIYDGDCNGGHFNVITHIKHAFTKSRDYCRECDYVITAGVKNAHICKKACPRCKFGKACPSENIPLFKCTDCKRRFFGGACYDKHKQVIYSSGSKTVCDTLKQCEICHKMYTLKYRKKGEVQHTCYEIYCKNCHAYCKHDHLCYMQKAKSSTHSKFWSMHFFDLEARQEDIFEKDDNLLQHRPNLCVLQNVCYDCYLKPYTHDKVCEHCGPGQKIFRGDACVEQLIEYLISPTDMPTIKMKIAVAHNLKGYDGAFILAEFARRRLIPDSIIMTGRKIQTLKFNNLVFKDSLNFLNMPLDKIPATFNFANVLNKGFFPHLFNRKSNYEYIGVIPHMEFYGPDTMSPQRRESLIKWHAEKSLDSKYVFNFQNELEAYCISDVGILRQGSLAFMNDFVNKNNVEPFHEKITVAGACMLTYKRNFIPVNTIGLIPSGGYRRKDNQSVVALKWLSWIEHSQGITLQSAYHGAEYRIKGVKVDGYHSPTRTVYEFFGCWYHACIFCFKQNRSQPFMGDPSITLNDRYIQTLDKNAFLRSEQYTVIEMWECHFKLFLKQNDEARTFYDNSTLDLVTAINPRDSFFGGRTNVTVKYHKSNISVGEKILYYDVCSLYPYINKTGVYPKGHPEILLPPNIPTDFSKIFGLVKCRVLPPNDLYHPTLPCRINGKLMFPLCYACASTAYEGTCDHSDTLRSFVGTFVSEELREAIACGYQIIETFEVWQYKKTVYDKTTGEGGLFAKYIDHFLKIKIEATGWPQSCDTDVKKQEYLKEFKELEGITLDYDNMKQNSGSRSLAKMCLNSLWGKFGQRPDLPRTVMIKDYPELNQIINAPGVEVSNIIHVNDEVNYVVYKENFDEITAGLSDISVIIASWTTALARLRLYSDLKKLDRRVLYFDTDSIIFTQKPGDAPLETSDFLGGMTCEISAYGPGSYIHEFLSGGPKNYCYTVACNGDTSTLKSVVKVRGISLNYQACLSLNFDSMKRIILSEQPIEERIPLINHIRRRNITDVVTQVVDSKLYRVVYSKRKRNVDKPFDTLPFGFVVKKAKITDSSEKISIKPYHICI